MNASDVLYKTSFAFTSVATEDVDRGKDQSFHLGAFLDNRIDLADFGSKITSIRFIPTIVSPGFEKFFPNQIIHHRSRNELGIYWQMDYDRIMRSTVAECKIYLADFFLEVLTIAKNTKPIRDFDYDGFIAAVKAVLPEWLASELEV